MGGGERGSMILLTVGRRFSTRHSAYSNCIMCLPFFKPYKTTIFFFKKYIYSDWYAIVYDDWLNMLFAQLTWQVGVVNSNSPYLKKSCCLNSDSACGTDIRVGPRFLSKIDGVLEVNLTPAYSAKTR